MLGPASWSDKSLVASKKFYPKGVSNPESRLRFYATQFPLVEVDTSYYAIPLAHVSETIELGTDAVRTVKGKEVLLDRDDVLPLFRLRSLVGLPAYMPAGEIDLEQVVVLDLGDRRAALVIDELTSQEEIVVKQYDTTRDSLALFGGATILSDGTPALIFDVSSLL